MCVSESEAPSRTGTRLTYIICRGVVRPHVRDALIDGIRVVDDREGSQFVPHGKPVGGSRLSLPFLPLDGDVETESPVRELKSRVDGHVGIARLGHGIHRRPKHVNAPRLIVKGERGHEISSSREYLIPRRQGRVVGERAVLDLGKIHGMWLLPDEQRVDLARGAPAGRVGHLAPSCAFVPLKSGPVIGGWEEVLVHPRHAPGQ